MSPSSPGRYAVADKAVVLAAVTLDGLALEFAPPGLCEDWDVCLAAVAPVSQGHGAWLGSKDGGGNCSQ